MLLVNTCSLLSVGEIGLVSVHFMESKHRLFCIYRQANFSLLWLWCRGNAITFVMDIEGISFPDAVVKLGERVGIHLDVEPSFLEERKDI